MRFPAILALLAAVASADTVVLKNGGRLEGVTTRIEGDKLVVKHQSGTVKFNRADVAKVIHRATPMDEYEPAAAKLKKDDAKGHFELANWCLENDLKTYERIELEATLAADPEHKEARARLGYEKVDGKWLRGEELLKARGMVKVDGKWVTEEGARAMAAEKERKRLEKALKEAESKARREKEADENLRDRDFYDSMRRYSPRDDDFNRQRAPRPYPRRYYYDYSAPYWYSDGSYFTSYTYYPGAYTGFYGGSSYYPSSYYGGLSIGFRYTGSNYSFSFGTNHYGGSPFFFGSGGYRRYIGGSYAPYSVPSFGPVGSFVPGPGGTQPGYFNSPGSFDKGGNPHYGGTR